MVMVRYWSIGFIFVGGWVSFGRKKRPINRIPNDTWPEVPTRHFKFMFIFHAGYVAIGFAGWKLDFPSPLELFLWRFFACVNLGSIGITWIVDRGVFWLYPKVKEMYKRKLKTSVATSPTLPSHAPPPIPKKRFGDKLRNNSPNHDPEKKVALRALLPVSTCAAIYVIARAYVIVEDFANLRALPRSAYQTVEWSLFIPHF